MMKKSSVKRLLALVLVLALVLSVMAVTVLADDSDVAVVYDGKEDAVVFKNPLKAWLTGEHAHPDLFTDIDLDQMVRDYFKRFYNVELTEEELHMIYHPAREASGK